ncbi:MAG: inositol monophosphatase [Deltaproteobacteria bacterium]|jgi:myo-inositol-1(or 4)-monophosphatase|nr:inositol monophosphatase [Deltaproteobacteria bacterium]
MEIFMKNVLLQVTKSAGQLLMQMFEQSTKISYKGDYDLVTEADLTVETYIVETLQNHFPDHDFIAEEKDYGLRNSNYCWIIDPLDGTTNFAHGFPWFAVSIALEVSGKLTLGAVYNPYVGEIYYAELGRGAFLNNHRISISKTDQLGQSLLATGFAYDHKDSEVNNYDNFETFQKVAQACRRPGVASLDLASVAAGRFDGFWEMNLKPWDLAAGKLIVEEAGGLVSDFDGQPMALDRGECLATNGHIHLQMLTLLQKGRRLSKPHS